jgi:predicted permease
VLGGVPLNGSISTMTITIPGRKMDLNADGGAGISIRRVTPRYHSALRIPLKAGRLFTAADRKNAPNVVIINESAAKKYFPGEDPVGRTVSIGEERTVVGVVGNVRQVTLEAEPTAEAFIPIAQTTTPGGELLVRTSGDRFDIVPAVKAAVFAVLPDVPLRNVNTIEQQIARRIAQRKLNMMLLGLFGLLGLVIAAVGIYGLMAFLVAQRTREIGVRIALGATRWRVVRMVLLKASVLVTSGLVVGSVAAWYLSAASRAFLFQLEPTDPRAFLGAAAAILTSALVASAIPARRAAAVDPMVALRSD